MQASWGICRPVWRPSRAPWWGGTSLQQQLARAQAAVNKADGQRTRNWNAAAGQSFAGMGRADVVEYAAGRRLHVFSDYHFRRGRAGDLEMRGGNRRQRQRRFR